MAREAFLLGLKQKTFKQKTHTYTHTRTKATAEQQKQPKWSRTQRHPRTRIVAHPHLASGTGTSNIVRSRSTSCKLQAASCEPHQTSNTAAASAVRYGHGCVKLPLLLQSAIVTITQSRIDHSGSGICELRAAVVVPICRRSPPPPQVVWSWPVVVSALATQSTVESVGHSSW